MSFFFSSTSDNEVPLEVRDIIEQHARTPHHVRAYRPFEHCKNHDDERVFAASTLVPD